MPLSLAGVSLKLISSGPSFDFMRNLKIITRFNLGYPGSDHCGSEQGAGSNALALCYARHASRSFAFHHRWYRVRSWSSPRTVGKYKVQSAVKFPEPHRNLAPPARYLVYRLAYHGPDT